MRSSSEDSLESVVDAQVASELRRWADLQAGRIRLPARVWHARGYSGAELVAVLLEMPGRVEKLIVKVCPAGGYARETRAHQQALAESPPAFATQHLVKLVFPPHPMPDDRVLMFQGIATNSLVNSGPLGALPEDELDTACRLVTHSLLLEWNAPPPHVKVKKVSVSRYLRGELADILGGRSAQQWAADEGLPQGGTMEIGYSAAPNPYQIVDEGFPDRVIELDYLYGRAHGDLHVDNVLWQRFDPPRSGEFFLIDLSAFSSDAPLSRDPVALALSVISRDVSNLPDGQLEALLSFVISPRPQIPSSFKGILGKVVWATYEPGLELQWPDEWQAQYLLSVLATALRYTTFVRIAPRGRQWYVRLASHAADAFLGLHNDRLRNPTARSIPQRTLTSPSSAPATPAPQGEARDASAPSAHQDQPARADLTGEDTQPPGDGMPQEKSDLCEILVQLYPDQESAHKLLQRLPDPVEIPPFNSAQAFWTAMLKEADEVGVINFLTIVNNDEQLAGHPRLIGLVRRVQKSWRPDFTTVSQLADDWRASIAEVDSGQNGWSNDAAWTGNTAAASQVLRQLITEVEKLHLLSVDNQHLDFRPIKDLLYRSQQLLGTLREPGVSQGRRRRIIEELQRLDYQLAMQLDEVAAAFQ